LSFQSSKLKIKSQKTQQKHPNKNLIYLILKILQLADTDLEHFFYQKNSGAHQGNILRFLDFYIDLFSYRDLSLIANREMVG